MKRILIISLVTALLSGCSKQGGGLSLSGTNGPGDFVPLVVQCTTNRGGHLPDAVLPSIQASWTHQSRDMQDILLISGDHFAGLQNFLEQTYGAPDTKLGSSPVASIGDGRTLTYSPQQCGVVLSLTAASGQTIVSVMGWPK